MKLDKQIIEDHSLSDESVAAIEAYGKEKIQETRDSLEGAANQNAQRIIEGAAGATIKKFGIEIERENGEKLSDYLIRVSDAALASRQPDIDKIKSDYEERLAKMQTDPKLKETNDQLQADIESLKEKYAGFDELKEKAEQFEASNNELKTLRNDLAWSQAKPKFNEKVNQYEADFKWNQFVSKTQEKYNIEWREGKGFAIDKENDHIVKELADLVAKDTDIKSLIEGRQQQGLGNPDKLKESIEIEGVPFKVPKEGGSKAKRQALVDHLVKEGYDVKSKAYADKFAELWGKISSQQTAS